MSFVLNISPGIELDSHKQLKKIYEVRFVERRFCIINKIYKPGAMPLRQEKKSKILLQTWAFLIQIPQITLGVTLGSQT